MKVEKASRMMFFAAVPLATSLAIAALAVAPDKKRLPVVVSERQNGGQIVARQGRDVHVVLNLSAATGYGWEIGLAPDTLQLLGKSETRLGSKSRGEPIRQIFRFATVKTGKGILSFNLRRPSDHKKVPAQIFKVIVIVLPAYK